MDISDNYVTTGDGLTLHYKTYINAPATQNSVAIICLPGLTRNERDFDQVAPFLAEKHIRGAPISVFCVSFRGRGQSDHDPVHANYQPQKYAEDIICLMDHEKLAQAIFIGTSLGGIVTMVLAATAPTRIIAAILNDIGPELAPEGIARIAGYAGKSASWNNWADAAAAMQATNGPAFPKADTSFWQIFARHACRQTEAGITTDYDPAIAATLKQPVPAADLWPLFKAFDCPILSIRGELSDLFTKDCQVKMEKSIPRLMTTSIPDTGHAPTLEEPTAKKALTTFLETL